ncbi:Uncharacterized protein FWK35_00030478 [Aphis craccivora]|uniref:Uncharacterized protein n=1 Tax=Aphis craccivora TaxID=307492 RepID=A0A6G0YIG0_APHCR|nr:Uncharacterized protein FWK35_00030478 [Aphis craccivora]
MNGGFSNSERSEECIDFTMIITSRNNAPISNYGGGFRCKSEYPWCIIETFGIRLINPASRNSLKIDIISFETPVLPADFDARSNRSLSTNSFGQAATTTTRSGE